MSIYSSKKKFLWISFVIFVLLLLTVIYIFTIDPVIKKLYAQEVVFNDSALYIEGKYEKFTDGHIAKAFFPAYENLPDGVHTDFMYIDRSKKQTIAYSKLSNIFILKIVYPNFDYIKTKTELIDSYELMFVNFLGNYEYYQIEEKHPTNAYSLIFNDYEKSIYFLYANNCKDDNISFSTYVYQKNVDLNYHCDIKAMDFNLEDYNSVIQSFEHDIKLREVNDTGDAIEIVFRNWRGTYGKRVNEIDYGMTGLSAITVYFDQQNDCWLVVGSPLKETYTGKVPHTIIKKDGQILAVWMG